MERKGKQMQGMKFEYYYGMEADQYSFYRVPKMLFTEACFQSLSCEAKILYGLMLDRMGLSVKNQWFDEKNRVYIIFTVEEIMDLLGCGRQKAVRSIAELDGEKGIGLIEKKRMGQGKPNIIYVKNFVIEDCDAGTGDGTVQEDFQKYENQTSGSMKNGLPEVRKSNGNDTEDNNMDKDRSIISYQSLKRGRKNPDAKRKMDEMEIYRAKIRENIGYDSLTGRSPLEREEVDELVELMVEVMMMPAGKLVKVAGEQRPVEIVKNRLMKLTYAHMDYVLSCLHKNTTKVVNIRAYLLTTLYNATMTMNHYYQAEVNHDMYGGM